MGMMGFGGLLAASAAGFMAVAWLTPDPNRQLVEDLPVLENLDFTVEPGETVAILGESGSPSR